MNPFYYSDENKWNDIEKQAIFEAWVPFIANRPLPFFIPYADEGTQDIHSGKRVEGFVTNIIGDDSLNSSHLVVNKLKRRKVVVLSRDEVCQNRNMPEILVARIYSVKDYQRYAPWYEGLLNGKHEWFVHLPAEITGKESYINMTQVMPIGKNLLIQKHDMLSTYHMAEVEARYEYGVDLGVIKLDGEEEGTAVNE